MVNRRSFHTATLLADGRVLVAGGYAGPANAAVQRHMEIYDPVSNRWEDAGSLNQDRAGGHTATLLPNGQVLVVGSALVSVPPGDSEPPLLITPSPQAAGRQRPAIAAIQGARRAGVPLQLQGSGFLGDSEGGSGATQQSASNLPVLRLERLGVVRRCGWLPRSRMPRAWSRCPCPAGCRTGRTACGWSPAV